MNYMGIERDLFSHPRIYGVGGEGFCVLLALGSLASREWRADGRVAADLSSAEAIGIACAGASPEFVRVGLEKLVERKAISGSETEGWKLHPDIWRRIAGQAIMDRHRKQHSGDSAGSTDSGVSGESATSDSPTVRPSVPSSLPSEAQKKNPPTPRKRGERKGVDGEYDADFLAFWNAYPVCGARGKKGKRAAAAAFQKLSMETRALAAANVSLRKDADQQWARDGGQFIPQPSSYLNGRGWEDEWQKLGEFPEEPRAEGGTA